MTSSATPFSILAAISSAQNAASFVPFSARPSSRSGR